MYFARACTVLLLVTLAILAKTPTPAPVFVPPTGPVCDRYRHADMIFTASAQSPWEALFETGKSPIHKRSEKSKRVRFLVREWYKGKRQDLVTVWMTPGNCPLKIEANGMYLVYASMNKDNGRIESNACMGTAPIESAAADVTYLTAAQLGPGYATRISGTAGGPNVNVLAKSGIDKRYAATDGAGKFTLDGLHPGDWDLSVAGSNPQQVHLAPDSCVSADLPH